MKTKQLKKRVVFKILRKMSFQRNLIFIVLNTENFIKIRLLADFGELKKQK